MKKIITAIAILFACKAQGQTVKGDTIFVDKPIRFINIQGRLYEIQPPTLREVSPQIAGGGTLLISDLNWKPHLTEGSVIVPYQPMFDNNSIYPSKKQ